MFQSHPLPQLKHTKQLKTLCWFQIPKPNEWGSWQVKEYQFASSTAANSNSISNEQEDEEEVGQVYQPQSPYYSPEHPSEFYKDGLKNFCTIKNVIIKL